MALERIADPGHVIQWIRSLAGHWEGGGSGQFPTIESFDYREVFRANVRQEGEGTLHYEQQTWRVGGEADGEPLHWESGFFMVGGDGSVELLNAQESRRVEVLVGELLADPASPDRAVLRLRAVVQEHDARMVATTRELTLTRDELAYAISMATTKVVDLTPHLEARLQKKKGAPGS